MCVHHCCALSQQSPSDCDPRVFFGVIREQSPLPRRRVQPLPLSGTGTGRQWRPLRQMARSASPLLELPPHGSSASQFQSQHGSHPLLLGPSYSPIHGETKSARSIYEVLAVFWHPGPPRPLQEEDSQMLLVSQTCYQTRREGNRRRNSLAAL